MILGWWLGCAAPLLPMSVEDSGSESALDDRDYEFCHEPATSVYQVRDWCALLEKAPPDKCPGMQETCALLLEDGALDLPFGEAPPRAGESCARPSAEGSGEIAGEAAAPTGSLEPIEPIGCDSALELDGLQRILTWVGAFGVAFVLLLLARMLVRTFGAPRMPVRQVEEIATTEDDFDEALPDVPNLPSADLLAAARQALAEGRAGEAVLLARGAALRRLGEQARVRLHRSRTDREYVRALRGEPEAQKQLRSVMGAVEHHRWGGAPLGLERAGQALVAVERLLAGTVATLLGWALLAMASPAALAQGGYGRYGPNGDAALYSVLETFGYDAQVRLRSLSDLDEEVDALVLDLNFVNPHDEHWGTIHDWVNKGGVLLVAGNPVYVEDFEAPVFPALGDWVELEDAGPVRLSAEVERDLPVPSWSGGPQWVFTGGTPWVEVESAGAVVSVVYEGDGVVIAIADGRLLWNASFVDPDNESFVGELLYYGQATHGWDLPTPARVQLATTGAVQAPSGGGAENPLDSLWKSGLWLMVLHLLLLWAMLGLWLGWPFAPLWDPPQEGRLEFSEHVQALGTRWFRMRASRYALVQTARLWLARLGSSGLQLAARRSGKTSAQAARWVADLQALVDDPQGPDDPSDLERMEELWKVTHPPT